MAQLGETLHDEINLQQVVVEMTSIWPSNEGRYASERSSD